MDDALERRDRDRVEAQMFEIDLLRLLVADTHHHTFLVCAGRYRRAADVALAATECARAAAILRPAIGRASCRERACQYVWIPVVAVALNKQAPADVR